VSASAISPDRMAVLKDRLRQLLAGSGEWVTTSELMARGPGASDVLARKAIRELIREGEVLERPATRLRPSWGYHSSTAATPRISYRTTEYALARGKGGAP
jgi:hypothetical protein